MADQVCGSASCGRPSDGYFICARCAATLSLALSKMSWLLTELDLVTSLQTRYASGNGRSGQTEPPGLNFLASKRRANLETALRDSARKIANANAWPVPNSPRQAARFLHYRMTAIRLSPEGPAIVESITHAHKQGMTAIDRPAQRQYLGDCEVLKPGKPVACPGRIYGRETRAYADCDICGLRWDAKELRAFQLAALEDRLCTASEIADLGAYLDLRLSREQTRKRLNQWHKRGLLPNAGSRERGPIFRFGTAHALLTRYAESA